MDETTHLRLLGFIVERLEVGILAVDRQCRIVLWNRFMETHSGRLLDAVQGQNLFDCFPELPASWLKRKIDSVFVLGNYAFTSWEQRPFLFRFKHNRPITGGVDEMRQNCTFLPLRDASGEVKMVVLTLADYTDTALIQRRLQAAILESETERRKQRALLRRLQGAKAQLFQSEKLASIGQLAAGVAHEINNPVGFVTANLGSMERYLGDLTQLIGAYDAAATALPAAQAAAVQQIRQKLDYEFIREDLTALIKESREGLDHIRRIILDLKDFTRVDQDGWQAADLEKSCDSTLNVVWNELKYKAQIVKDYTHPPHPECIPGQINQVLMNLLVNAGHAIGDQGTITLRTGAQAGEPREVWVEVQDSGHGIAAGDLKRIFDPFFTTKAVGQGTGLGLSVSYSIMRRHGGRIEVRSEPGQGACFRLVLPVQRTEISDQSPPDGPDLAGEVSAEELLALEETDGR